MEEVEGGGGGVFDFMHGRSRIAIDPRIPTIPGRSTSSFVTDQADIEGGVCRR